MTTGAFDLSPAIGRSGLPRRLAQLHPRDPPRRREPAHDLRLLDLEDVEREVEGEEPSRVRVAREVARAGSPARRRARPRR